MTSTPDTTMTWDTSANMLCYAFRNVNVAQPNDTAASYNSGGSGDPISSSITTVTDDCFLIAVGMLDDDSVASSVTLPSGYSNLVKGDSYDTSTIMAATKLLGAAGATGTVNWSSSGSDDWAAYQIALRPA